MYTKIKIGLLSALLLVAGFSVPAHAQVVSSMPNSVCVQLSSNLFMGNYDVGGAADVTKLQIYLNNYGYMNHVPTGYFGGLTWSAVVRFQKAYGILQTGYVGPVTRAKLQSLTCNIPDPGPVSTASIRSIDPLAGPVGTQVSITVMGGSGYTSGSMLRFGTGTISNPTILPGPVACVSAYNCPASQRLVFNVPDYIAPYCAPGMFCTMMVQQVTPGVYPIYIQNADGSSTNTVNFTVTGGSSQQFSVGNVSSPSSIPLYTPGTWTINVNNTGGNLHYSVVWGDEVYGYNASQIMAPAPQNISTTFSVSHTFNRTGTFNPTFTISDDFGHTATVSTSVVVTPIY